MLIVISDVPIDLECWIVRRGAGALRCGYRIRPNFFEVGVRNDPLCCAPRSHRPRYAGRPISSLANFNQSNRQAETRRTMRKPGPGMALLSAVCLLSSALTIAQVRPRARQLGIAPGIYAT